MGYMKIKMGKVCSCMAAITKKHMYNLEFGTTCNLMHCL